MTAADDRPQPGDLDAQAASASTDPFLLHRIFSERPDLHPALAANEASPVTVLQWLRSQPDPAIQHALSRNRSAITMGIVEQPGASTPAAPAPGGPWAAPTAGSTPAAPPAAPRPTTPPATASQPPVVAAPIAGTGRPQNPPIEASATTPLPVTAAVPRTVAAPADATPAAGMPRPPAPGGDDDKRRSRGFGLLLLLIPLLFLGGCLAALALARDDGGTASPTTSAGLQVLPTQLTAASTATTAAAPPTDGATTAPAAGAPAGETPGTGAPATEAPATDAPATGAATPATTRAQATAAPTTARTTATTARPAATTTTIRVASAAAPTTASATGASAAYAAAQQFATALANGDWAQVRKLSPASKETDAQFTAQYGNLDSSTVIPAKATARSATVHALRVGLVAYETNKGVKQTTLYCAHWDVDTKAGTVTRVDGTKLRTENGTKSASSYSAELATTCASVALD